MASIKIYSSIGLEPWKWDNPDLFGIGGSETSHIEMVRRLSKRGYDITSFCPMEGTEADGETVWTDFNNASPFQSPGLWVVYRDPKFFDAHKHKDSVYWFIAQDCDYDWTPERLAKVDRYWCLCRDHASYTVQRYPQLRERIYVTSNGIKSEQIEKVLEKGIKRNPNKIVYTSSPDRGLMFLLENWARIRERLPELECHIFYGFENMLKLGADQPGSTLNILKNDLERLMRQDGIVWRGRVSQPVLWEEYASANVWFYPTDWPETSCISCMEAQALGAIPVTTDFWALRDNVQYGIKTSHPPQQNNIDRIRAIDNLEEIITISQEPSFEKYYRSYMMRWAKEEFNWDNFVDQWEKFINVDCKCK